MQTTSLAILAAAALSASASAQPADYQVTFKVSTEIQNMFVYADEFNGEVYAWDLTPMPLGTVKAGTSTFSLGHRDIRAWAILASHGSSVASGINDSIDPPDGLPFETVFSGYPEADVFYNINTLYVGGAFNIPQAFYLTEFVLAVEDTLKTDLPTGKLQMYTFSGGLDVGTATFALAPACYPDFTGDGALDLFDFLAYVNAFNAGDTNADCDHNGALDLFDFLCFVNAFNAGC